MAWASQLDEHFADLGLPDVRWRSTQGYTEEDRRNDINGEVASGKAEDHQLHN
jgi:hypothetical protein